MAYLTSWDAVANVQFPLDFVSLTEDETGLHIILADESDRQLQVDFPEFIAYRSLPLALCRSVNRVELNFELREVFWFINNSLWAAQFHESASDEYPPLFHSLIALEDFCIEVLSEQQGHGAWNNNFFGDAV